jgi:hypothetical protein
VAALVKAVLVSVTEVFVALFVVSLVPASDVVLVLVVV